MTTVSLTTLYLSRLILNSRSRQVRIDLADPYEMHRTLCFAFPGKDEGGCGRILWRVDHDRQQDVYVVYVQSDLKPDWTKLVHRFGDYLDDVDRENQAWREITPETFTFDAGRRLAFRLRANPSKKVGTSTKADRLAGHKSNGKRVALCKSEDQIAWLQTKAEANGFKVRHVNLTQAMTVREMGASGGRRSDNRRGISVFVVQFDGILEVIRPEAFREALFSGIGPAKGLGMGLLSIANSSI